MSSGILSKYCDEWWKDSVEYMYAKRVEGRPDKSHQKSLKFLYDNSKEIYRYITENYSDLNTRIYHYKDINLVDRSLFKIISDLKENPSLIVIHIKNENLIIKWICNNLISGKWENES